MSKHPKIDRVQKLFLQALKKKFAEDPTIPTTVTKAEPKDPHVTLARRAMSSFEKRYQEKNPCPDCGSKNVHIDIDALGGGHVAGSEWCDDCGWKRRTDTFPE